MSKSTRSTTTNDAGEMVRGSLVLLKRRCGKPNCRCANGPPHQSWVLSYSLSGRTRMLPVREEHLADIRRALARYRDALRRLEEAAQQGIELWRRRCS